MVKAGMATGRNGPGDRLVQADLQGLGEVLCGGEALVLNGAVEPLLLGGAGEALRGRAAVG